DADRDLGRKSVAPSEDGCADDRGKPGIDQSLAAHDHEAAIELGIVAGMMNPIDFAPSQTAPSLPPLLRLLIAEDVLHFLVQFVRSFIDEFEIASLDLRPRLLAQVAGQHGFDKCRARLLRSCHAIDARQYLLRECDRGLLFHTTNILPCGIPRQLSSPSS